MDLSPEEYGAYWRGSAYVTAGILFVLLTYRFLITYLLSFGNPGALAIGFFLLAAVGFIGTFVAVLGIARVVRTAVDAEMRG